MVHFSELSNNTAPQWWRDPGLRKGMFHIFTLFSAVYTLGYDGSLLAGLQALPAWQADFNYPTGYRLGLISASYYLPKIPAAMILAWCMDRWGRKPFLLFGAVVMIAGAIAGGLAPNEAGLIGSRVMLGIGTVSGHIAAQSMVPELAHPRIRPYAGSYFFTTFYVGSIFASWLTFAMVYAPNLGSYTWRIPTYIQGFGPFVLLVGCWFLPESPRWLMMQGREAEAHQILATYHANGDMDDELVLFEVKQIKASIAMEALSATTSVKQFVATPANRRRLGVILILGTVTNLAGNGVVQYYLIPILRTVGITSPTQTAGINGGLSIWNWFVALGGAGCVERFGRRPLFLTSFIGMLASFILITGLSGSYDATKVTSTGIAMVPFIFVFMGFYSLALTPLPSLYVPEISPISLRAKAVGLQVFCQNTAAAFNQFVNPIALAAIGWKYYGVYVAVIATYLALFYFFVRETRGMTAEEASTVYESADRRDAAIAAERMLQEQVEREAGLNDAPHVDKFEAAEMEELEKRR